MVEHLTSKNFDEFISSGKVVIDLYADWCGPCQMMAPVIEELSRKLDDVKFAKVDVDSEKQLASKFGIMSIPCFIAFKDGKEVDRIIGGMHKTDFEAKLRNIFGS